VRGVCLDRRARIVANTAVGHFQGIVAAKFGHRTDHVVGRFRKPKRSTAERGDQAEHKHGAAQEVTLRSLVLNETNERGQAAANAAAFDAAFTEL
jgi:hypothetical protein